MVEIIEPLFIKYFIAFLSKQNAEMSRIFSSNRKHLITDSKFRKDL